MICARHTQIVPTGQRRTDWTGQIGWTNPARRDRMIPIGCSKESSSVLLKTAQHPNGGPFNDKKCRLFPGQQIAGRKPFGLIDGFRRKENYEHANKRAHSAVSKLY